MWPDWSDQTAIIVGTGPSAGAAAIGSAKGRARVIVIKSTWRLAPWADCLYGLDKGWWIANHGAPKFKGLKISPSPTACRLFGLRQVRLRPVARVLTGETGVLGCGLRTGGGHSGFQAINLAIQFGARRIILVGFDMTLRNGAHWNGEDRGTAKPDAGRTNSWRAAMDDCAEQLVDLGVDVRNTSERSELVSFRKMPLERALEMADAGEGESRSDQSGLQCAAGSGCLGRDAFHDRRGVCSRRN